MLKEFGFSQYESAVYEVLVSSNQPMDVAMLAKYSSVPKTKIYEVLSRMIDKGMIMEAISDKKKTYTALSLDIAVERLTAEFQNNIEKFKAKNVKKTFSDDRVWSFKMQASIQAEMKKLMAEANRSIRISTWSDDFIAYLPILEKKEQQGLDVHAHVIGDITANIKNLDYFVPTEEEKALERFQLLVVDDKELIFATVEDDTWQAIRTMSQPFVKFFSEFFYHDMVLTRILGKYKDTLMNDSEIKSLVMKLRY
ncbi:MAG: TrmB family transcriptional regulator [Bacillus sp. (in: firmicutes)]